MIETFIQIYVSAIVFFAMVSVLRLESSFLDLNVTRSRETKVLMRQRIKRARKDMLLSLVWPYLTFRLIKSCYLSKKSLQ